MRMPKLPKRVVLPRDIHYRGRHYRRAQDEAPAEEGAQEEAQPFAFKDYQIGEDGATVMAQLMVAGLAAKLMQDGVTKDEVKAAKPAEATNMFTTWVKLVGQERTAFGNEVRLLQRLGPEQYLYRKAQQLKSVKAAT